MNPEVIVVGAGGAGLAAAVSIREAGLSCLVVEQAERPGGTTGWSVGSVCGCLTDDGPAGGDRVDDFLADIEHLLAPEQQRQVPRDLRDLLARESGGTIRWLQQHGVPLVGPHAEHPHRRPRIFSTVPDGRAFVFWLYEAALRLGARFHFSCRMHDLLIEAGAAEGIRAESASGETVELRCSRAVVLAAGDFAGNDAMRRAHLPEAAARGIAVNSLARGEGIETGLRHGAAARNMHVSFAPQVRFVPATRDEGWAPDLMRDGADAVSGTDDARIHAIGRAAMDRAYMAPDPELFAAGAVLVSGEGDPIPFADRAARLALSDSQRAFMILDSTWLPGGANAGRRVSSVPSFGFAALADYLAARPDLVFQADALDELASAVGIDAKKLAAAVESSGRAWKAPFLALGPARPVVSVTEGSLAVDGRLRVLGADGTPSAERLHAIGSNGQGGLLLWGHGLHLAWALTSGRLIGSALSRAAERPV